MKTIINNKGSHEPHSASHSVKRNCENSNQPVHQFDNLEDLIDTIEFAKTHAARMTAGKLGFVPSTLILATPSGLLVHVPPRMRTPDDSMQFDTAIKLMAVAYEARAAVVVVESSVPRELELPPSESIDREKLILVLGETPECRMRSSDGIQRDNSGKFVGLKSVTLPDNIAMPCFTDLMPANYHIGADAMKPLNAKNILTSMGYPWQEVLDEQQYAATFAFWTSEYQ